MFCYRSGDRTARIWDVSSRQPSSVECHHPLEKEKDVTTLDWHPSGGFLATGSYDGLARVWTKDGGCLSVLSRGTCHCSPSLGATRVPTGKSTLLVISYVSDWQRVLGRGGGRWGVLNISLYNHTCCQEFLRLKF